MEAVKRAVLVGTYKGGQLERWPGFYNYPLSAKDVVDVESARKVNELWLFQGAKGGRFFAAEFVGRFTRDELKARFAYPAKGRGHGEAYLLYRIGETELYSPPPGLAEAVIVRSADFATAPKVRRQIKAYLESPDRNDPAVAKFVPEILTQVPREVLRVCETTMQLDFAGKLEVGDCLEFPFPAPKVGKFTFIDLFAGIGGIRLGYQLHGGRCVFSSEWDRDAAKTYFCNFGERPYGDIQKIMPQDLPDFDIENVQTKNPDELGEMILGIWNARISDVRKN